MALVADRFLSSWFLRLSGFFGCYQGRVAGGKEMKILLVWAHLPTDSTCPNLRSPFSFVFQLIRASTTAKAILFRILILSSSSSGIHLSRPIRQCSALSDRFIAWCRASCCARAEIGKRISPEAWVTNSLPGSGQYADAISLNSDFQCIFTAVGLNTLPCQFSSVGFRCVWRWVRCYFMS